MQLAIYLGLALFAALITLLPALVHSEHRNVIREAWRRPLRLALGVLSEELGAVTVTYYIRGGVARINGSTTGPTAAQASEVYRQQAVIVFGVVGDTTALFTHNWGLDASGPGYFAPEILFEPISTGTTSWPLITFYRGNTNVLVVGKVAGDTATTVLVSLRRPHSVGQ